MERKFLIFAPPYSPDMGGAIVMHKLCSIINDVGREAYICRLFNDHNGLLSITRSIFRSSLRGLIIPFEMNRNFVTPVLRRCPRTFGDEWIVVYPEIINGNPLRAKNVVRWMLHKPGFHTGRIQFGEEEFHIDYGHFLSGFPEKGCYRAKNPLTVVHFPFEIYNEAGALCPTARRGTAYCLRKGVGARIQHDLSGSILIDGKSSKSISRVFRTIRQFISYDPHTAYSQFATLCGAESVVVPMEGISKEEWCPDPRDRYGVAYGWDDLVWARETAGLLLNRMREKEAFSVASVQLFLAEVTEYFDLRRERGAKLNESPRRVH